MTTYFTSESVTRGHPDKVCDQIADCILDALLVQDPKTRSACEVTCTTDQVHIFGEITTRAKVDYEALARQVIARIGYTEPGRGFDAEGCTVQVDLHEQSPDITRGISRRTERELPDSGAGDQGMMFGYACKETEHLMPMPIELAHDLAMRLERVRLSNELPYLLPDGKTQVTVQYEDGIPKRASTIIVSCQHTADIELAALRADIVEHVILPVMPPGFVDADTQIFVNPAGRFVIGGPAADSGLTGRKLMVDTYGGYARHGGGSFSGKDATKVDRSGAYMARYLAKNVVKSGVAERCEIQLCYAIGLAEPVAVRLDTFGTGKVSMAAIERAVLRAADLRPFAIAKKFNLTTPCFSNVSCYGHFGKNAERMPWEQTDFPILL